MKDTPEIAAARIARDRARSQLVGTVESIERPVTQFVHQMTPKHLMREAWDGAKDKGADLVEDAVDAVRARPFTASGVVAAIAMFLAREPLMDLAGKLVGGSDKKKAKSAKAPAKKKVETKE